MHRAAAILLLCYMTLSATAFANDLLGLPKGILSSKLKGDSSWVDMRHACEKVNGVSFGESDHFCAVKEKWTQLSSKMPGDSSWSDMKGVCEKLGGISFGATGIFCALKGKWRQFVSDPYSSANRPSMADACKELEGYSFGAKLEYCVVQLDKKKKKK